MATFRSTFAYGEHQVQQGGAQQLVFHGRGANGLDELTTTGTTGNVQDGGSDWEAPAAGYVTMNASAAMWVQIAAAPTAVVATGFYMAALADLTLSVQAGDKIAVIDDS